MNPRLEALLKALDDFSQAGDGAEADRLLAVYEAMLNDMARELHLSPEVLDNIIRRKHPRWVRANLPKDFPRGLPE